MGTERDQVFVGPCPCGKGSVSVDRCSPDHMYPVAVREWHEARLDCPTCSATLAVDRFGDAFCFVKRSELADRQAMSDKAAKKGGLLLTHPLVVDLKKKVAAKLDELPSGTARHKFLARAGYYVGGIATFRKRWTSGAAWVNTNVSPYSIDDLMRAGGSNDPGLLALVAEVDALFSAGHAQATPLQPPFHKVAQ